MALHIERPVFVYELILIEYEGHGHKKVYRDTTRIRTAIPKPSLAMPGTPYSGIYSGI